MSHWWQANQGLARRAFCMKLLGELNRSAGLSCVEVPPKPRACHPICPFWKPSAATSAPLHLSNSAPRPIPSHLSCQRFCQSCHFAWANWHLVTHSRQSRRACASMRRWASFYPPSLFPARCSCFWMICTGPIPPRSTCSATWLSIKRSPASASWVLTALMNWRAARH